MDVLYELGSVLASIIPLSFWDYLDIGVLWFLIYKLLKFMRETRAAGLAKGLIMLAMAYLLANLMKMKAVMYILNQAMDIGLFALVVLFQPELRRFLEKIGHSKLTKINVLKSEKSQDLSAKWVETIEAVCEACEALSNDYTGALIVFERETKLGEQIDTGTIIDAIPSNELLGTIFFRNTPLHDGALIMRDSNAYAAGCQLPKPQNQEQIDKALGSRHRAAIGMSENSDAITVVVSEQTGVISVTENGVMRRNLTRDELKKYLRDGILTDKLEKQSPAKEASFRGIGDKLFFLRRKK